MLSKKSPNAHSKLTIVSLECALGPDLRFDALDPEGSNLVYKWTWDSRAVSEETPFHRIIPDWGDAGQHSVHCYVSDGLWTNVFARWEVTVLSDNDKAGVSNADERLAGTNPMDPGSFFRIKQVHTDGEPLNLVISTVPGRTYRVMSCDSLSGIWQQVGDAVTADTLETSWSAPITDGMNSRFFRITVDSL